MKILHSKLSSSTCCSHTNFINVSTAAAVAVVKALDIGFGNSHSLHSRSVVLRRILAWATIEAYMDL